MSDDDRASARKLRAAITVTGAVLWLTSTGLIAHGATYASDTPLQTRKSLSQRVEELREKVRAALPQSDQGSATGGIRNIVQFFNFLNCQRNPTDRRCARR